MFLPYQELLELAPRLFPSQTLEEWQFQPASVDLTVRGPAMEDDESSGIRYILTNEVVAMPNDHVGFVWGKQGLATRSIFAGIGSGLVPPGWVGRLTIAISCDPSEDLREPLAPGKPLVQLAVARLTDATSRPYGRK